MSKELWQLQIRLDNLEEEKRRNWQARQRKPGHPGYDANAQGQLRARSQELVAEISALNREIAQKEDETAAFAEGLRREEEAFWIRRFVTTLSIAHAAGFLATMGGLFQAQDIASVAPLAFAPLCCFAGGLVVSGPLPFLLYIRTRTTRPQGRPRTAEEYDEMEALFPEDSDAIERVFRSNRRQQALAAVLPWAIGGLAVLSVIAFVAALFSGLVAVWSLT